MCVCVCVCVPHQVKSLEASLQSTQSTLKLAGQPHAFILEQLQAAKTAAQEADMKALAATTALKVRELTHTHTHTQIQAQLHKRLTGRHWQLPLH